MELSSGIRLETSEQIHMDEASASPDSSQGISVNMEYVQASRIFLAIPDKQKEVAGPCLKGTKWLINILIRVRYHLIMSNAVLLPDSESVVRQR